MLQITHWAFSAFEKPCGSIYLLFWFWVLRPVHKKQYYAFLKWWCRKRAIVFLHHSFGRLTNHQFWENIDLNWKNIEKLAFCIFQISDFGRSAYPISIISRLGKLTVLFGKSQKDVVKSHALFKSYGCLKSSFFGTYVWFTATLLFSTTSLYLLINYLNGPLNQISKHQKVLKPDYYFPSVLLLLYPPQYKYRPDFCSPTSLSSLLQFHPNIFFATLLNFPFLLIYRFYVFINSKFMTHYQPISLTSFITYNSNLNFKPFPDFLCQTNFYYYLYIHFRPHIRQLPFFDCFQNTQQFLCLEYRIHNALTLLTRGFELSSIQLTNMNDFSTVTKHYMCSNHKNATMMSFTISLLIFLRPFHLYWY